MALKYTTTLQLAQMIGVAGEVPTWDIGSTPANETVGTGDNAVTTFYLDQRNIIASSYTIYANAVAMTEITDYTLDKDAGLITLTAAGVTALGTDALTAEYKYFNNSMSDGFVQDVLERAEKETDNNINSTFTDGTATNPTYPSETEIQPSEGLFMDRIIVRKKPVIDIETTVDGAHTDSVTTISLASGTGANYPSTGTIIIGSEAITYTGVSTDNLTGCTRAALGSVAAAYVGGEDVHSTLLFRSSTVEGTAETFVVQPWDTSSFVTEDGLIYKFKDADPDPLSRAGVANRVKIIYLNGYNTIPVDITRLALLLAKRQLIQDNIGKSMIAGRDEFRPEMFNVDMTEINSIINDYIILGMENS